MLAHKFSEALESMKSSRGLLAVVAALLFFSQPAKTQTGLPPSWDGIWKGETKLTWANGKVETAAMELDVSPIPGSNAKRWRVVYVFSDRREVRDYELRPATDGGAGRFIVDEKNGFLIDNYLANDTLYSQFTINHNLVTTRFELKGQTMAVELTMFDTRNPRLTKLTGGEFEVASFSPKYVQRGVLRREQQKVK
jgi:hypothetical protein